MFVYLIWMWDLYLFTLNYSKKHLNVVVEFLNVCFAHSISTESLNHWIIIQSLNFRVIGIQKMCLAAHLLNYVYKSRLGVRLNDHFNLLRLLPKIHIPLTLHLSFLLITILLWLEWHTSFGYIWYILIALHWLRL